MVCVWDGSLSLGPETETADGMIPPNDILEREHETGKHRPDAVRLKGGEGSDYKWV